MTKTLLITGLILLFLLFLSRFVLLKMRWSDQKAIRIFREKNVPLGIHDTVIDGRRLHYAVTGSRDLPTLVIIHGSPGSWFHYKKFMWDETLRRKFRIIVVDRPGFGFSDYGKAIRLQDQASLVLPLLQNLKTDQPMFLCGHSYGGALAAKLAADAPRLFKTLVIVAGSLDPSLEKKEKWRYLMSHKPLSWFLPGAFQASNTELLYLKEDLIPLAGDLEKITAQVLFIHGDKDTWVPIENVAYGMKMMKNAAGMKADTFKGAAHHIPWKRREELRDRLMLLE